MYMPYPLQITQSSGKIQMVFAYANASRTISHLPDPVEVRPPVGRSWNRSSRLRGDPPIPGTNQQ